MRKPLSLGAVLLGVAGVLLCAAAVGVGWWAAVRTVDRIGRATARLDQGLSEADERLARVEGRVKAAGSVLNLVRGAAEAVGAEDREMPRLQAKIEELLDRLAPALDRVEAIAVSLKSVTAGLRTVADLVDQLDDDVEATVRVRNAADRIDRAAEALDELRIKLEAARSAKAVQSIRDLVNLARDAIAGSERLAEGLATVRTELAAARGRAADRRGKVVVWIYAAATANTVAWLWGGLGQLCLIGWGRRRLGERAASG